MILEEPSLDTVHSAKTLFGVSAHPIDEARSGAFPA
jgi:hypothetical protein